jgi:WD40 repeat protein
MRLLTGHKLPIGQVRYSPDGRWLLVIARAASPSPFQFHRDAVRVWDLAAGTNRVLDSAFCALFTPDSRSVLYAATTEGGPARGMSLHLSDLTSGTAALLAIPGSDPQDFIRARFNPGGTRLLSFDHRGHPPYSYGGEAANWTRYPGWQPVGQWQLDGRFDPDSDERADGSKFVDVAFSPDGKTLAAATTTSGLVLFEVGTGNQTYFRKVELKWSTGFLAYHPDGRQLVVGSGTEVTVFDARTGEEVARLRQRSKHFLSGNFTPDGRRFLTASNEGSVKCWDTATWTLTREYAWGIGGLRSVAVAPDGLTAAAGGEKKTVVLFDLDD